MIRESSRSPKGSQYFKCQGYGYIATQYPSRNLLIKETDDDEIETVVHEAIGSVNDSDDNVRVASIQLGVIKCPHTDVGNEYRCRSSVFYIYIAHERKHYKLIVNGDSCVNIIVKTALEKMGLKTEPHPNPHNIN